MDKLFAFSYNNFILDANQMAEIDKEQHYGYNYHTSSNDWNILTGLITFKISALLKQHFQSSTRMIMRGRINLRGEELIHLQQILQHPTFIFIHFPCIIFIHFSRKNSTLSRMDQAIDSDRAPDLKSTADTCCNANGILMKCLHRFLEASTDRRPGCIRFKISFF